MIASIRALVKLPLEIMCISMKSLGIPFIPKTFNWIESRSGIALGTLISLLFQTGFVLLVVVDLEIVRRRKLLRAPRTCKVDRFLVLVQNDLVVECLVAIKAKRFHVIETSLFAAHCWFI